MLVIAAVLITVLVTGALVLVALNCSERSSVAEARREAETIRREAKIEAREEAVRLRADVEREGEQRSGSRRSKSASSLVRTSRAAPEGDRAPRAGSRRPRGARQGAPGRSQAGEAAGAGGARAGFHDDGERGEGAAARPVGELVRHDLARRVRQLDEEAQGEAKRRARNLVADALQRVAASHAAETTSSLIELPSDDMKGRIIGREGRNIRTLEHLTGVDVIVDDTPQAVVLSSFDPIRREIAKMTLLKLVEDGRIQPARIEEMYYQSKAEIDEHILQAGEQAVFEANCGDFHEELVKLLGRLNYRTSYGQNVLKHTLEVVHLAGLMATELDANVKTAKRAAMLHDVGKAVTHEIEGSHAQISTQYAKRYNEAPGVVHAVEAHHYEVQPQTVEAVLLIAADAISGARPERGATASRTTSSAWRRSRSSLPRRTEWRRCMRSRRVARSASSSSPPRSTTTRRRCSHTRSRATSSRSSSTPARSRSR